MGQHSMVILDLAPQLFAKCVDNEQIFIIENIPNILTEAQRDRKLLPLSCRFSQMRVRQLWAQFCAMKILMKIKMKANYATNEMIWWRCNSQKRIFTVLNLDDWMLLIK